MSAPDTDTGTEKPPEVSAEQAADWAALEAGAAGAVSAPVAGQVAEPQGPPEPTPQAMGVALMVVGIVKPIACVAIPGVKEAPEALWEPVASGVAGLLDHYGLAEVVSSGPWARFGLSVAPLAGFVAVAMLNAPEPEKKPASAIYQVPGAIPPPPPSDDDIAHAAKAEPAPVGFHQ